ncbi:MAG TPA: coagulation factor 5/8 type domain-containing protein [Acidimicrobiales bacterium]|nr:coagulation factor 5/8 type domain-containing protein [Acidimicrobiales bacterium]
MPEANMPRSLYGNHRYGRSRRLRHASIVLAAAFVTAGLTAVSAPASTALADPPPPPSTSLCPGANLALFGPNVCVFNDMMPQATIQADLNAISDQQVPNQFGSQRYAIFFEPGTYGSTADPLVFQVGFYTEVAGLGAMPQDTVINGLVLVFNQCVDGSCLGLDNFWRSMSNLTINVTVPSSPPAYAPPPGDPGTVYCDNTAEIWAVSQAAPIRRVIIDNGTTGGNPANNGNLVLQDYCGTGFVSGGFIADSEVSGAVDFYGQQQYIVRNSNIGSSSNSVWNMVFSGVNGAPATDFGPSAPPSSWFNGITTPPQYTTLTSSPVTEEEPFLYSGASGNFNIFVPAVQHNSIGPSWASGSEAGTSLPSPRTFVANPSTPTSQINRALAFGQDLILTPGVYDLYQPIVVSRPDTVVLGLGFATLVPEDGNAAMIVAPNNGVKLSGLIFDAGPVNSPVLLMVGTRAHGPDGFSTANDPDLIQDVFFRVGGAETTPVSATVSFIDNADNSIIDDMWVWRADHGGDVGWTVNTGDTGVIVTGDDVTAYGLAVEHFQKDEVIWSGQGGTDIFFQNENPYDPPSQSAWMATPAQDGYPAFLVTPNVRTFQGYGMGSYSFFDVPDLSPQVYSSEAFEAPDRPGVQFHDLFTIFLNATGGYGGILSVINGTGGETTSIDPDYPQDVVGYP